MKITISDTSFHNKIMSRYRKGKSSLFLFPSMFFLRSARGYLSRIINMHVRLNFQIHNKFMNLSSVLLKKFHEIKVIYSDLVPEKNVPRGILYRLNNTLTLSRIHELISGFHEINKISVNATTPIVKTPIFNIVNYQLKKSVSFRKENSVFEKSIYNSPMIINRIPNILTVDTVISPWKMNNNVLNYSMSANNSIIIQRIAYSQIFNHPKTTTKNFFSSDNAINTVFSNYVQTISSAISSRIVSGRTYYHHLMPTSNNYSAQTKSVNYWYSNYMQILNNNFTQRTLNKGTSNHQNASYNFFALERTVDNKISNFTRIVNNNLYPGTLNKRTFDNQTAAYNFYGWKGIVDNRISNIIQMKNYIFSHAEINNDLNILNYLRTKNTQILYGGNNFTLRSIGKNYKFNTRTTALSDYLKDTHKRIAFSPASTHFDFATHSKPEMQNGINSSNNNMAGADIIFRKPQIENKITGEKKLNNEITISAKIRADKQIKNVPPQILQGEISSIANKVYKLLERRLSIEKEKRGVHIIG